MHALEHIPGTANTGGPTKFSEGNPRFIVGGRALKLGGQCTKSSGVHEPWAVQRTEQCTFH